MKITRHQIRQSNESDKNEQNACKKSTSSCSHVRSYPVVDSSVGETLVGIPVGNPTVPGNPGIEISPSTKHAPELSSNA